MSRIDRLEDDSTHARDQGSSACLRHTALVADDDDIMLHLMEALLTSHGYDVVLAASGREAINAASSLVPSIAFLDLAMPGANGLQICSMLRRMPGWADVPIVIVTHYSIEQGLPAARRAGASGFLCKPIVPDELSWCLEAHDRKSITPLVQSPSRAEWREEAATISELPPEMPLPPVGSRWILKHVSNAPLVQPFHISDGCPNWASIGSKATGPLAGVYSASADDGPDQNTLSQVASLFPHGRMVSFLGKLFTAIQETLALLEGGVVAVDSDEVQRRLHNLAGTAGTLGCKALSTAARELEADRSGLDQILRRFIEVARTTCKAITTYNSQRMDGPALASARILDVLVVDDVPMIREIASTFLRTAGHNVTCVEGGAEAITAVSTMDFHVVLMDIRMPKVDGLEATRRIRSLSGPRSRVPIVALTALMSAEQVAECLDAGADTHLAKPFDCETLLAATSRVVPEVTSVAPNLVRSMQLSGNNRPY